MSEIWIGIISGVGGAAGTAILFAIARLIRARVKLTGPHAEAVSSHERQLARITPLVILLVSVQKPQLLALLGLLSAMKEKMNGDFERAYQGVKVALNDFDSGLLKALAGECEDAKP